MSTLDEADKLVDRCRGWREWAEWEQGLLPDRLTRALTALRDAVHDLHCRIEAIEQNRVQDRTAILARIDRLEKDRTYDRDRLVGECARIAEQVDAIGHPAPRVCEDAPVEILTNAVNGMPVSEP